MILDASEFPNWMIFKDATCDALEREIQHEFLEDRLIEAFISDLTLNDTNP